jgi:ABC-type multidrug transport system fused ATPase/permease subunit
LNLGIVHLIYSKSFLEENTRTENRIVIDGIDVEKIGLHELRRNVAMIPQDPGNS